MTRDKDSDSHSGSDDAIPDAGAFADVETRVLLDEDDPTELVAPPPDEQDQKIADALAATKVFDPDSATTGDATAAGVGAADSLASTRVLNPLEDKTSPPAVRPPTPIDPSKGLPPGMILFGEYEIVNVLGVGGMGEVYRARHRRLDEHRAIKVMHADLATKKGASEFFYREAKALLAVRHPAVVHCHDLLSDEEGRVYLIMEMIEGIPLSKKMNDGPLSPDDVAILGARIAHGLSAAHRKGVIHRDLSPDNIVLPNGRVHEAKIIDFGIAKILQEGDGTIVDGFKGKLSYASPEQLGFFGGKIDGRSDFYSLGLLLAAAALGRPLPMGTSVMEAVDARRNFSALPDSIPVGLRSAIQPLLALEPDRRPKYVDRLFVVPGGIEGASDRGGYSEQAASSNVTPSSNTFSGSQVGLFAGLAAAGVLLIGAATYFLSGVNAPTNTAADSQATAITSPVLEGAPSSAINDDSAVASTDETPAPIVEPVVAPAVAPAEVAAKVAPPERKVRRLSATDRIKIIGLLSNAKLAAAENQLMSPARDNAYDRYRRVLALDPSNRKAKAGLRNIASRYISLTDSAAAKGDLSDARRYLDRARKADENHPGISAAESRLGR